MGLTKNSTGSKLISKNNLLNIDSTNSYIIALAGNPNVGKSTVFNSLTGLKQHTGNWPGKTVMNARGKYQFKDESFTLVDLPGTYSIMSTSEEEEIARNFVCFAKPDVTVIVADATSLERNLNLTLQVLEITNKVVVCVNLIDEAKRKGIEIKIKQLSKKLGVPVVATNARDKKSLVNLEYQIHKVANNLIELKPHRVTYEQSIEVAIGIIEPKVKEIVKDKMNSRWIALKLLDGEQSIINSINEYFNNKLLNNEELQSLLIKAKQSLTAKNIDADKFRDKVVTSIVTTAEQISKEHVSFTNKEYNKTDRKIDRVLTSKFFGIPIMIGLLGLVFWLTITGANYPSAMLANFLFGIEAKITVLFNSLNAPSWLHGILVLGVYRTLAWVISVMLPPMAIFFPMFTFLEDLGYLPRIAFNLDKFFKKACAHGKQALTMCMGFGCNAAGVIGCRIIDSPRERLIAIITNNFVPCNGRFPTLIAISMIFIGGMWGGKYQTLAATLAMVLIILLGIFMTLFISKLLSKTILKGMPSSFTLELPPYRKPQVGRILVRSLLDRTLFVLGRAIAIAAPAGIVIWVMANIDIGSASLLTHSALFLEPFAKLIGMDGYILMAFILGLPANEIVVPIIIMSYMASGSMLEFETLGELKQLLINNGWTLLTAINVMLFSLMHFPCGTTLWTIKKETQSRKWTFLSFLIPTVTGIIVCFIVTQAAYLLGLM